MQIRLNSAFTGFFNNRLLLGSRIAIVMLSIFFIASSFRKHSDDDLRSQQVNLIIREIGHRLLLQAGDLTSRVLPVTESKEGLFLLKFENELVFNHDSLFVLTQSLLPKTEFPSGYTVTVHDCKKGDIVYGFQVNNTSADILACSGRSQPPGCYTIEFDFPDFYANVERKKADVNPLTESVKVDPEEVHSKLEEFKTTIFDYNIDQLTESAKVDLQKVNPKLKESKTTTSGYGIDQLTESAKVDLKKVNPKLEESKSNIFAHPIMIAVYSFMLLMGVILLVRRFEKISKQVPVQHQDQDIIKEPVPELAALGKFLFDVKNQRLLLGSEIISLTDKEDKVLELLHENFGELIPRDTLMQEVWINEGVITGRSLDMFISKLRKKLSVDPDLRIKNIHGKGYRLETVNDFIS